MGRKKTDGVSLEKSTETPQMQVLVCSPAGLNLRSGPGRSYPVICVLTDGTEVKPLNLPVAKDAPDWVPVLVGRQLGWVEGQFLQGLES